MNTKRAVILRGLPGSGKSTLAALMQPEAKHVHSTDKYFIVDGEYRFDASKLAHYHDRNFDAFCIEAEAGVPLLVVDNTNTRVWEYQKYIDVAKEHGYQVSVVTVGDPRSAMHQAECFCRCTHGVPREVIRKMGQRFEP